MVLKRYLKEYLHDTNGNPVHVWKVDGRGRDCRATVEDGFVFYVKIMYGYGPSINKKRRPRLYYGRVIDQTEDVIEFDPLTADEFRAARA